VFTNVLKSAAFGCLVLLAPSLAWACDPTTSTTACLAAPCTTFGKSQLDVDKQNLIICLSTVDNKTDCSSGSCQWKAMNGTVTEKSGSVCDPASSGAACLALPCKTLGKTQMDADKKNIVACLSKVANNTDCSSNKCLWKPMGKSGWSFDEAKWYNVTSQRGGEYGSFPSTTFTNTHDHPMAVAISATSAGSWASGQTIDVNGAVAFNFARGSIGEVYGMVIVPAGATYAAHGTMLWKWWELY